MYMEQVGNIHHATHGDNIHYVPTALCPHLGQHRQRGVECTPEHHVQGSHKILHGWSRHGAHLDTASIVDHNINTPKTLCGLVRSLVDQTPGSSHRRAQLEPRCLVASDDPA